MTVKMNGHWLGLRRLCPDSPEGLLRLREMHENLFTRLAT
jgi:hypothetical protein